MNNKYYSSYRRFTYDWDYADQEEYSKYEEELENLEVKEIIPDEEYNATVSRLEASNNLEELENYRNHFVPETEYHFTREELLNGMKNLQTFYRVTEEKLAEDRRIRVSYAKDILGRFKTSGYAALRNVDIDSLSDDEIIELHRIVTHGKSSDEIRNISNESIRKRTESIEIEVELNKFREISDRIKNQFQEIEKSLILSPELDLGVNEVVENLGNELVELREMGNLIIADMDAFRLNSESANFSMSVAEIKKTVKDFTVRFKNLKVLQIEKYNARVDLTNKRIKELKDLINKPADGNSVIFDSELVEMANSLSEFPRCNTEIKSWTQTNYLKEINYTKLVEVNKLISNINNKIKGVTPSEDETKQAMENDSLEADIDDIEKRISDVEAEINAGVTKDNVDKLLQDLNLLEEKINNFKLKLESNKDSISGEKYAEYKERVEKATGKVDSLRNGISAPSLDEYKDLEKKATLLENEIVLVGDYIGSLSGHITKDGVKAFEERLVTLEGRLSDLRNEIEEKHKDSKIDDNQYKALMDRVNDMEAKLSENMENLKHPEMIKDVDIYSVLNGEIDGLDRAVNLLVGEIEKAKKPIGREDRKKIDKKIKDLEKEIARLEKVIKNYKDKDPEKYNSLLDKLNKVKDKLNIVGKNYRKSCPLVIRGIKSTGAFFKKHKKIALVSAGLAVLAAVSSPVLIPAIMQGNIMLDFCAPALRPFATFSNNILGGLIGARFNVAEKAWYLANGTLLNPQVAATSLLKGAALSGVGHAALLSPIATPVVYSVVVGIKKLVEKMKSKELKQKLTEGKEKIKESVKTGKEKVAEIGKKGKASSDKKKAKKADRDAISEIAELFKEYRKSGKSLEEFAADAKLSEAEIAVIKYFIANSEERKNNHDVEISSRRAR